MEIINYISSFYPPLSERRPLPGLFVPAAFSLTIIPFFIPSRKFGILITYPLLVLLALSRPCFTSGDPSADYSMGGAMLGMSLWYLDFLIISPAEGSDIRFIGAGKSGNGFEQYPKSWFQKFVRAFRLMITPNRGIGWTWQVKGVPPDPDNSLPKWNYVRRRLLRGVITCIRSLSALYVLGIATTLQSETTDFWIWTASNITIGWAGAIWAWNGINYIYSFAAAITVTIGMCEQWEWPPLTGSLLDAWSVRQMWSTVYHQLIRRMVQQPGIRLARLLGFRKGSFASSYVQLYVAFAMSCLYHEANIFHAARRDIGEFIFFMPQPIAITIEDLVQWCYRQITGRTKDDKLTPFARSCGYLWVFIWFSYSLPPFVKGLRDAGIISDAIVGTWPFDVGIRYGFLLRNVASPLHLGTYW